MYNVALFGKKYEDTIITTNSMLEGETNSCNFIQKKLGGVYNFLDNKSKNITYCPITSGVKKAYIINNKEKSKRTSFVFDKNENDLLDSDIISKINVADWLHMCYIDDINNYNFINKINIPISIDFCTAKPRKKYLDIMNKSRFVFDSRERKNLYDDIEISTPIIFHDEYGLEICVRNKVVYSEKNNPISNLEVNGAGDMFAAIFIENNFYHSANQSAKTAMLETTKYLINRNNNEQEV